MKNFIERNYIYFLSLIIGCSSAILSIELIIGEYNWILSVISGAVSFFYSIYLFNKVGESLIKEIKNNKILSIIILLLSFYYLYLLFNLKIHPLKEKGIEVIKYFRFRYCLLSVPSIYFYLILVILKIKTLWINFYKKLDSWDKKAFKYFSIVLGIIVIIIFSINNNFYLQYDYVYSLDSGFVFNNIFKNPNYYDIRHPLMSIITFPISSMSLALSSLFYSSNIDVSNTIYAIIIQIINVELIIVMGLMIKKLTNNKNVFILYMCSFPTMLFTIFLEKYTICTFLVVLYIYLIHEKENEYIPLTLAAGCMPTSAFAGIAELLRKDKFKNKIKNILKIIILTAILFIVFGRIWVFKNGLFEMTDKLDRFTNDSFTIKERFISSMNMFKSVFVALPSSVIDGKYLWNNIVNSIDILSIIIFSISIIGFIFNRKNKFYQMSLIWILFSFILFIAFNWSVHESPLFSQYFSWAIIPLFVCGCDKILQKLQIKHPQKFYNFLIIVIIIINISTIINIYNFVTTL